MAGNLVAYQVAGFVFVEVYIHRKDGKAQRE